MNAKLCACVIKLVCLLAFLSLSNHVLAQSACSIDSIRLGGQPGDLFIGPTRNQDGSYRTCYYAVGTGVLVPPSSGYVLELNGDPTVIAAFYEDAGALVICATDLNPNVGDIDVFIQIEPGCSRTAENLYNTCSIFEDAYCAVPIPATNRTALALLALALLILGAGFVRRHPLNS